MTATHILASGGTNVTVIGVLLAILVAVEMVRMLAQALLRNLRPLFVHAAWRERPRTSDAQFLRATGIKR